VRVWLMVLVALIVRVNDSVRVADTSGVLDGVLLILWVWVGLGVRVWLGVLVGLGVRVSLGVLVGLGVRVSLGVLVGLGVFVVDSVMVGLAVRLGNGLGVGAIVCVSLSVCVATGSVGVEAEGVVVAVALTPVGVAVVGCADGLLDGSLSWPGDGGVLMMIVLPSGMRDRLSLLFIVPKSIRSINWPVAS
jgi:hypothetical protein